MKKRIFIISIICLAVLLALTVSIGMAQQRTAGRAPETDAPEEVTYTPDYISVQGRLTDASGTPLNGTYILNYRYYDDPMSDEALCTFTNYEVDVVDGLFSGYMPGCWAIDGRQLYFGISVGDDPEMTPRQVIDNVPYAYGLRPGAVISGSLASDPILHIENWATNGRGLRAYAMSETGVNYGVVGASRSPDGFGGFFYNNAGGTALRASSGDPAGVAIAAKGVITSTEETYLWISGNDVREFHENDSTIIDMNAHGGARISRGADSGNKAVVLPITIPGTLYGQDVKLTALDLYWQGDTSFDAITLINLRRQTGVCGSCYSVILSDDADYTCWDDENLQGCVIQNDLVSNNILNPDSGVLYLRLDLAFEGEISWIDFGGARLTLVYDR